MWRNNLRILDVLTFLCQKGKLMCPRPVEEECRDQSHQRMDVCDERSSKTWAWTSSQTCASRWRVSNKDPERRAYRLSLIWCQRYFLCWKSCPYLYPKKSWCSQRLVDWLGQTIRLYRQTLQWEFRQRALRVLYWPREVSSWRLRRQDCKFSVVNWQWSHQCWSEEIFFLPRGSYRGGNDGCALCHRVRSVDRHVVTTSLWLGAPRQLDTREKRTDGLDDRWSRHQMSGAFWHPVGQKLELTSSRPRSCHHAARKFQNSAKHVSLGLHWTWRGARTQCRLPCCARRSSRCNPRSDLGVDCAGSVGFPSAAPCAAGDAGIDSIGITVKGKTWWRGKHKL